jgi:hypothetical protein
MSDEQMSAEELFHLAKKIHGLFRRHNVSQCDGERILAGTLVWSVVRRLDCDPHAAGMWLSEHFKNLYKNLYDRTANIH